MAAEEINWGGEDNTTWVAKNYTAKEWEPKANRGKGGPKRKVGLPDAKKALNDYIDNYERTFGHI